MATVLDINLYNYKFLVSSIPKQVNLPMMLVHTMSEKGKHNVKHVNLKQ